MREAGDCPRRYGLPILPEIFGIGRWHGITRAEKRCSLLGYVDLRRAVHRFHIENHDFPRTVGRKISGRRALNWSIRFCIWELTILVRSQKMKVVG
jgi:hypothetical protein